MIGDLNLSDIHCTLSCCCVGLFVFFFSLSHSVHLERIFGLTIIDSEDLRMVFVATSLIWFFPEVVLIELLLNVFSSFIIYLLKMRKKKVVSSNPRTFVLRLFLLVTTWKSNDSFLGFFLLQCLLQAANTNQFMIATNSWYQHSVFSVLYLYV